MADDLNIVPVLQGHLTELERVLGFVEGLLVSHDLAAGYQKMETVHRASKLTLAVQQHRQRVQGYLAYDQEEGLNDELAEQ